MQKKHSLVKVMSLVLVVLVINGCRASVSPARTPPAMRVVSTMPAGTPLATNLLAAVAGNQSEEEWTRRTAWTAEASFVYQGGPMLLSGAANGTLPLTVDDAFRLTIRRPDNSTETFYYDFSAECTQPLAEVGPFDLGGYFLPGLNRVQVEVIDMCASAWGTPGLWLVEFR